MKDILFTIHMMYGVCKDNSFENLIRAASVALELVVRAQRLGGGEVPDQRSEHLEKLFENQ